MPNRFLRIVPLAFIAGCSAVQDDFSKQVLTPPGTFLCEPAAFGIAAEPFEVVVHGDASLTGWWLPNPKAQGRTVVLFHSENTDAGSAHPYYRFLHDAGYQVLVFDPRGYGRSRGTPTLRAWLYDLSELFAWLHDRPDVDRQRIAFVGTGLGSCAALWAARTQGGCAGLVLEGLPSPRNQLKGDRDDASALGAYTLSFVEFASLPENFEPIDNAPFVKAPALFLAGEQEPPPTRAALLRTFDAYAGPRELWLMPATGAPPHGMSTHDGEYQRTVVAFLDRAFGGSAERLTSEWRKVGPASGGGAFYEVSIASQPQRPAEPIAVEAAVVVGDTVRFATTWLESETAAIRLQLDQAPSHVGTSRIHDAVAGDDGTAQRQLTPLARASRALGRVFPQIESVRLGQPDLEACRALLTELTAIERQTPFPPVLESELSDVFARIGIALLRSSDATEQVTARLLIERAATAVPAHPERHFWAGPSTTYGFPQQAAIDDARRALGAR